MFKCESFLDDSALQKYEKGREEERIQILIDFLGSNVLGMKIDDIKGEEIVQGNIVHIRNFLELILALCNVDCDDE